MSKSKPEPSNVNNMYKNIKDIPYEDDVMRFFQTNFSDFNMYKIKKINKGANNRVILFEDENNDKITFRTSIEPMVSIPDYLLNNRNSDSDNNQTEIEEFIKSDLINKESDIWHNADYYNISPPLYYYGIYRKEELVSVKSNTSIMHNMVPKVLTHNIYKIIINEGYDMNISEYYNNKLQDGFKDKQSNSLSEIDIIIAEQLINIFDKLHSKMKIICFDLKPANCVINLDPFDVRLIDLDGDWCHYNAILKKTGIDGQKQLIKYLSIMILANHFYHYCNWNIFSEYSNTNIKELTSKKSALKTLFCEFNKSYRDITAYYIYDHSLNRKDNEGNFKQIPKNCNEIFNEMFEDMFKLKPSSNSSSKIKPVKSTRTIKKTYSKKTDTKKNEKKSNITDEIEFYN